MVVLSVAICTKAGKPLVARQFVEMPQARVEGLVGQFAKLDAAAASEQGGEKQNTCVETDTVRYLYQPLEDLFIVMATSKTSNVIEDLDTLHIFAKLVSTYCRQLNDKEVLENYWDLVFAFDQAITPFGYKEKVTLGQIKSFVEMDSHEEKMAEIEAENRRREVKKTMMQKANAIKAQRDEADRRERAMRGGGSYTPAAAPQSSPSPAAAPTQPDPFVVRERAAPTYAAPSGGSGLVLSKKGAQTQLMEKLAQEDKGLFEQQQREAAAQQAQEARRAAQQEASAVPQVPREAVHVIIEEHVTIEALNDGTITSMDVKGELSVAVGTADASRAAVALASTRNPAYQWKVHPQCDKARWGSESVLVTGRPLPVGATASLLRWHAAPRDESAVPVTVSCWPTAATNGMIVNLEYSFSEGAGLPEVTDLAITVPIPPQDVPEIGQCDGDYTLQSGALIWNVPHVSATSASGSVEFTSQAANNAAVFFPINVNFASAHCFSGAAIAGVTIDGKPSVYSSEVRVIVDNYQISASN
eukprot:m51a1_g3269 Coatomer subunit delta (529) ;mRNA; f:212316-214661